MNQLEVARLAGVSRQSVSLALNHPEKLDPKTLAKIRTAIESTGYVPDSAARNFKRGWSGTLAMAFRLYSDQDFANPFLSQTLKGLHEAAAEMGFGLRFQPIQELSELEDFYRTKAADGVLFMSYHPGTDREFFLDLQQRGRKFVLFAQDPELPSVDFDFEGGCHLAAAALAEAGARRVAYLSGGLNLDFNQRRFAAWQKALLDVGLDPSPDLHFHFSWTKAHGREAVQKLLAQKIPFDGLFCADGDFSALGALAALQKAGLAVPGQVKILAGDGSAFCECSEPELSALVSPYAARAAEALRQLARHLLNGTPPPGQLIPMSLRSGGTL